ncbi:substrate-binding domain-containing protein [Halovivax limisalsi]|uniref:substrate-binding domain-containing protein n=1 Tax=Halovivax limisalsi TaxID=1453760 RepID=UPI001FFDA5BE|nr:substrate-binding domain-containing protein [Halovivax limisalsi]
MPESTVRTRRRFLTGAAAVGGVTLTAGCTEILGGDDGGEGAAAGEDFSDLESMEATIAHPAPPGLNRDHRYALSFKNYVENATDGQFSVEIAAGGELGNETEVMEQVLDGVIEFNNTTGQVFAPFNPNVIAWTIPYAFDDMETLLYAIDNQWQEEFDRNLRENTNAMLMGPVYDGGGFQVWSANSRVASASDFEGMSFRTMASPSHQALTEELGATSEVMSWTELYEALDTGVISGQKNPIATFVLGNLHEVQDYIFLDNHQAMIQVPYTNEEWFNGLPAAYQSLIREAAFSAAMDARYLNRLNRSRQIPMVRNELGVEIVEPDESTLDELRSQTQEPVEEVIRDEMTDTALLDSLLEAYDWALEETGQA